MNNITKFKHQVKSNKYYLFWGAATIAVVIGQIYVGNGYRRMSQQVGDLTEIITIKIELDELRNELNTLERRDGIIY
tara:strand:- start:426 stop:656 length:231 start_codon:yes stop_codon:yes gene_type:complete